MIVWFLFYFLCFVIAEEKQEGVNDCLGNVTAEVNVTVTYLEPYDDRQYRFCWSIPPRCSFSVTKFRTAERIQSQFIVKKELSCCDGYKSIDPQYIHLNTESYPICVPDCQGKCQPFGICIGPNQCLCTSGETKDYCDGANNNEYSELTSESTLYSLEYDTMMENNNTTTEDLSTEDLSTEDLSIANLSSDTSSFTSAQNSTSKDIEFTLENFTSDNENASMFSSVSHYSQYDLYGDIIEVNSGEQVNNYSYYDLLVNNITTTKPFVEKKMKIVEEFESEKAVLITGSVTGIIVILIGAMLIIYRKIVCRKFVISKRTSKSENKKPEIDLQRQQQDEKTSSTLTLEPFNLEEDMNSYRQGATTAQIEYIPASSNKMNT